jgi:hypothetical protein
MDGPSAKQTITILGLSSIDPLWSSVTLLIVRPAAKDVQVLREIMVRSCIVLPHKTLGRSSTNEVLL